MPETLRIVVVGADDLSEARRKRLKEFYPDREFDIIGVHPMDQEELGRLCSQNDPDLVVVPSQYIPREDMTAVWTHIIFGPAEDIKEIAAGPEIVSFAVPKPLSPELAEELERFYKAFMSGRSDPFPTILWEAVVRYIEAKRAGESAEEIQNRLLSVKYYWGRWKASTAEHVENSMRMVFPEP